MANFNPNNYGFASGRLVNDPKVWENDRTVTIKVKVALSHTRPDADGNYGSDFVEFTSFLRKDENYKGLGVYGKIHQGDRVNLNYSLRNNNWTDANGEQHYENAQLVIIPGSLIPQESADVRASHGKAKPAPAAAVPEVPVVEAPAAPAAVAEDAASDLDDVLSQLGI